MNDYNYEEIVLDVKAIADFAILVSDGDTEAWIPKSLIANYRNDWEVDRAKLMEIADWKLKQEGFI